jgi:hypothetical protein
VLPKVIYESTPLATTQYMQGRRVPFVRFSLDPLTPFNFKRYVRVVDRRHDVWILSFFKPSTSAKSLAQSAMKFGFEESHFTVTTTCRLLSATNIPRLYPQKAPISIHNILACRYCKLCVTLSSFSAYGNNQSFRTKKKTATGGGLRVYLRPSEISLAK